MNSKGTPQRFPKNNLVQGNVDQSYDTRNYDGASPRQKKKGPAPMFARSYKDDYPDDADGDDEPNSFKKQKERQKFLA